MLKNIKVLDESTMQCIACMQTHKVQRIEGLDCTTYLGKKIEYPCECYYCENEDTYFEDSKQLNKNSLSLKDNYRLSVGLYSSKDIINLRKKYDITQQDLCKVLGWGEKTINRYENCAVQDKAHDHILKKLDKDPEWFMDLLNAGSSQIKEESFIKSYDAATREFVKEKDSYKAKADKAEELEKTLK
ncbi:MAG: type II toxin-antitoxin system MqsA family antitoxin [Clostridia bacterium]|nr:type II toxin-antitoxin system MqsA family antitoxin [Clostridia bacterium]